MSPNYYMYLNDVGTTVKRAEWQVWDCINLHKKKILQKENIHKLKSYTNIFVKFFFVE